MTARPDKTSSRRADAAAPTPITGLPEPWFVYILRCSDGSLYTGIAKDVQRRAAQHGAGTASRYTRSRLPVTVAYHEPQPSHSQALRRELAIKALSRKAKESLIQSASKCGIKKAARRRL